MLSMAKRMHINNKPYNIKAVQSETEVPSKVKHKTFGGTSLQTKFDSAFFISVNYNQSMIYANSSNFTTSLFYLLASDRYT